jgi:hypothetical protein
MADEIDEPIEGGKDSPLEDTSSDINTESPQSPPPPEPPNDNHYESKQPRSQHFEATVEKATNLGKKKKRDEEEEESRRNKWQDEHQHVPHDNDVGGIPFTPKTSVKNETISQTIADEETRQSHVPIKSSSFEDTIVKAKKFGKTGNTTDYASTAQTTTQVPKREPAPQPFRSGGTPFEAMEEDTAKQKAKLNSWNDPEEQKRKRDIFEQNIKDSEFKNYSEGLAEEAKKKREKEESTKKTLEDYKNNRGAVGKVMDMFSRTHTQEMGYAAEQKVEGYLTKRREEKKLENKKRIEPLLIQNDQNLKEGIINKEMHAVREKQYLEKMEDITPLEEKIGKGVKREATSAFGILNEMATSPEARNKINAQRVKEGKAPLQSAMDDNSIAATFARGVASTSKQLHTKPAKSQPAIFTRGTEAPKFSGAAMHSLPTSSSFYGVGVGTVAAPRKGKGSRSGVSQKGGNPINFGGVGGGGFGGGGAPITFGSGFGLFGRGQPAPAPAPAPVKRKKR